MSIVQGTLTPADVLERAADALWIGEIRWGREKFITDDGCRCALGAIGYALDPDDPDGNPIPSVLGGRAADLFAEYLVDHRDADKRGEYGRWGDFLLDPVETVGSWNDDPHTEVADVIEALRDAAAEARRTAQAAEALRTAATA